LAEGRMAVVSPVTALVGAIVPMAIGLATGERPVLAGIGFGLFFAAIAQTGEGSGLWPLVGARTAQVSIAAILATIKGLGLPAAGSRLALVVLGAGDILANIFLLLAFRSGLLTIVSVLASLYPVVTVLLAVVILREHIHRRQLVGLTVALLAVALIAA
ncbi:MAG: EamA family transporter, partial [Acidimicrobiia bacterium]|nr:EamA family transporter [Acidimicrobiia bacterium]